MEATLWASNGLDHPRGSKSCVIRPGDHEPKQYQRISFTEIEQHISL